MAVERYIQKTVYSALLYCNGKMCAKSLAGDLLSQFISDIMKSV